MTLADNDSSSIPDSGHAQFEFRIDFVCEARTKVALETAPIADLSPALPASVLMLHLRPGTTVSEAEEIGRLLNGIVTGMTLHPPRMRA